MAKETKTNPSGATYLEIINVSKALKGTKNSGLSTNSFIEFLSFKRQVDAIVKQRDEDMVQLMEGYNIHPANNLLGQQHYPYEKHEKRAEIQKKVTAINSQVYNLTTAPFMKKEEFHEFTKGLDMDQVATMAQYLLKN